MSAKNEQIEFLLLNILSWGIEQKRNYEVSETLYFFSLKSSIKQSTKPRNYYYVPFLLSSFKVNGMEISNYDSSRQTLDI